MNWTVLSTEDKEAIDDIMPDSFGCERWISEVVSNRGSKSDLYAEGHYLIVNTGGRYRVFRYDPYAMNCGEFGEGTTLEEAKREAEEDFKGMLEG